MKNVRDYNLHDFLTFRINREKEYGFRDNVNLKFSYFEETNQEEPDIILNIGEFSPSNTNCYCVDNKYYIKDNYLFTKDSEGSATWKIEIFGIEKGKTVINFHGKTRGMQSLLNPDFLAQNFLLKFIEYKLLEKGLFLAHAGGVTKDGTAHIFPGRGGSYKSTLCMKYIKEKHFDLLGDDRVILDKKNAYSFPMSLYSLSYMVNHLKDESSWHLTEKIKFIKELQNNSIKLIPISNPIPYSKIIFISRTNGNFYEKKELTYSQMIQKLVINNRIEDYIDNGSLKIHSGPFIKCFFAYSYIFPESAVANYEQNFSDILSNLLKNVTGYELKNPHKYDLSLFEQIHSIME